MKLLFLKWGTRMCVGLLLLTHGCKKEDHQIVIHNLTGYSQKGPFVLGSSVSLSELTSSIEQTGKVFTTQADESTGHYSFTNLSLASNYVLLSSNGYYFNEVTGNISTATLTLSALADITEATAINVNILTQLEKLRVEYLVKHNKTFSSAKKAAQTEILAVLGMSLSQINNSESFDISTNNEGGAILLAMSVIFQGNRSIEALTELMTQIAIDIQQDGTLDNTTLMNDLRSSTKDLNLAAIRSNLGGRYNDLGLKPSIPDFEKYVNKFLEFTGQKPSNATSPATEISISGATLNGTTDANSLPTNVSFEYGTSVNYDNSVASIPGLVLGTTNTGVSTVITGLSPGATYHFRVKSENSKGVVFGDDLTFTTLGKIPVVDAAEATNVFFNEATINGLVNPNYLETTVLFEYGTTTSYGTTIAPVADPLTGSSPVSISAHITSLLSGVTYHFRVKSENSLGTVYSSDMTFLTLVELPAIGAPFQGGTLAYVLKEGDPGYDGNVPHGIIVGPSDLRPETDAIAWTPGYGFPDYNPTLIGVSATAIGSGKINTDQIVATQGPSGQGPYGYAAAMCRDLVVNGYDDWFLPSLSELEKMNPDHAAIGLTGIGYWSSTEYDATNAWYYRFDSGTSNYGLKWIGWWVRPVRYF